MSVFEVGPGSRHTRQGEPRPARPSIADWAVEDRPLPEPPKMAVGGGACWCGDGPVGHHGDGPHPGTRHTLREAAVASAQEGVQAAILRACSEATARNVGVLVLVDRGRPFWLGPHSTVPPGEVHWRAQAPDPGNRDDFSVWMEDRR